MSLSNIKSVDKATDRELLLMILSSQIQIARRIELLESKVTKKEFVSVPKMCDDIADKLDTFIDRFDEAIKRKHED